MRKLETPIVRARPSLVDPLERLPGLDEEVLGRRRPVDQVEVDVLHPEPPEALLERLEGRVEALLAVPELGRDEDLLARQAGGGDRRPDPLLVAVGGGGVDVAVAGGERLLDHPLGVLRGHLEDPESELRDLDAVVERQRWDHGLPPSWSRARGRAAETRPSGRGRRRAQGRSESGSFCDLAPAIRPTSTQNPVMARPIQNVSGIARRDYRTARHEQGCQNAAEHRQGDLNKSVLQLVEAPVRAFRSGRRLCLRTCRSAHRLCLRTCRSAHRLGRSRCPP